MDYRRYSAPVPKTRAHAHGHSDAGWAYPGLYTYLGEHAHRYCSRGPDLHLRTDAHRHMVNWRLREIIYGGLTPTWGLIITYKSLLFARCPFIRRRQWLKGGRAYTNDGKWLYWKIIQIEWTNNQCNEWVIALQYAGNGCRTLTGTHSPAGVSP
jgi:hypothetical protein